MATDDDSAIDLEAPLPRGTRGFSPAAFRDARRARGWSRAQLADALGISSGTIAGWERGAHSPRPDLLAGAARELQLDRVEDLLSSRAPRTLQVLRAAAGLTLAEAATAAGVSRATLIRAEQADGDVSARTLRGLAQAYSVSERRVLEAVADTRRDHGRRLRP